jgi:hypothetical protein
VKKTVFAIAVALSASMFGAAEGKQNDVTPEVQIALQSALQSYMSDVLNDGGLTYIELTTGNLQTVYPASIHPIVVPFGSDYFLCSEVVTDDGTTLTADFLLREIDGQFRVVQRLIDQRDVMKLAMSKL